MANDAGAPGDAGAGDAGFPFDAGTPSDAGAPPDAGGGSAGAPFVVWTDPPAGATAHPPQPPVRVRAQFNEPIDAGSLTSTTFFVRQGATGSGSTVFGTLTYEHGTNTAVFTANFGQITNGSAYRATLTSGIVDQQGEAMDGSYQLSFTVQDVTPPFVTGFSPGAGEPFVGPGIQPTVSFSEPMLAASFDGGCSIDGVDASCAYQSAGNRLLVTPAGRLENDRAYTVRVAPTVRDSYGVPLGQPFSFGFQTQSPAAVLSPLLPVGTTDVEVAFADTGEALAVFEVGTGESFALFSSLYVPASGTWSTPVRITTSDYEFFRLTLRPLPGTRFALHVSNPNDPEQVFVWAAGRWGPPSEPSYFSAPFPVAASDDAVFLYEDADAQAIQVGAFVDGGWRTVFVPVTQFPDFGTLERTGSKVWAISLEGRALRVGTIDGLDAGPRVTVRTAVAPDGGTADLERTAALYPTVTGPVMVWMESTYVPSSGTTYFLYGAPFDGGTLAPTLLATGPYIYPFVASDGLGLLVLSQLSNGDDFVSREFAAGSWTAPQSLGFGGYNPELVGGPGGYALSWVGDGLRHFVSHRQGAGWGTPYEYRVADYSVPQDLVSTASGIWLAFAEDGGLFETRSSTGTFSTPARVATLSVQSSDRSTGYSLAASGSAVAQGYVEADSARVRLGTAGVLGAPSTPTVTNLFADARRPKLAFTDQGTGVAIWEQFLGQSWRLYAADHDGGSFSAPFPLDAAPSETAVVTDGEDFLIAWRERDGLYARLLSAGFLGPRITVASGLGAGTLSAASTGFDWGLAWSSGNGVFAVRGVDPASFGAPVALGPAPSAEVQMATNGLDYAVQWRGLTSSAGAHLAVFEDGGWTAPLAVTRFTGAPFLGSPAGYVYAPGGFFTGQGGTMVTYRDGVLSSFPYNATNLNVTGDVRLARSLDGGVVALVEGSSAAFMMHFGAAGWTLPEQQRFGRFDTDSPFASAPKGYAQVYADGYAGLGGNFWPAAGTPRASGAMTPGFQPLSDVALVGSAAGFHYAWSGGTDGGPTRIFVKVKE